MDVQTLGELFHYNVTQYNKPDLLVYRRRTGDLYHLSTNEFSERVTAFARGLNSLGVKRDTKVILLSENRPEWHIADFACHLLGAVIVPIFPTLIAEQIDYIAKDSDTELIILSDSKQANKVRPIRNGLEKVRHVIAMDVGDDESMMSFEAVLLRGRGEVDGDFVIDGKSSQPDSLATIIYTSGTTGLPKGVMLSHQNILSNVAGCSAMIEVTEKDNCLSFLPLCHSFERTVDYLYFYKGTSIMYSNVEAVATDMMEIRPTIMASVPRLYEKVKAAVEAKVEKDRRFRQGLFHWAIGVGAEHADAVMSGRTPATWLRIRYSIADKLVMSKIRERTGGRVRYFISGGAPLSTEVGRFFFASGLVILEGYGLSETSPVISVNPPDRPKIGTVGKLLYNVEVKIAGDGEILTRGPHVMLGYYKMPEETAEVIKDGWFYTGDIGTFDDDGYLRITDRKKQLIVTSVGKKVAPQAVEKAVESSKYIEQVMLLGEKQKFISALIVPNFQLLQNYAAEQGLTFAKNAELVSHPQIRDLIAKEIDTHQASFSDYERIHEFKLLAEEFTVENGMMTPTLKVKRRAVQDRYADLIDEIYAAKTT